MTQAGQLAAVARVFFHSEWAEWPLPARSNAATPPPATLRPKNASGEMDRARVSAWYSFSVLTPAGRVRS
jgi:hypothetical protein